MRREKESARGEKEREKKRRQRNREKKEKREIERESKRRERKREREERARKKERRQDKTELCGGFLLRLMSHSAARITVKRLSNTCLHLSAPVQSVPACPKCPGCPKCPVLSCPVHFCCVRLGVTDRC
ncbi:hypothetical protein WMY93_012966 [Mugilogobius chulae]|uniref:Uncharacterized protein n=1 Tax=Mugilogobius chulae TaxID=88201 RepID=A0AAW0NY62_9GOBI